jgi:hypothetical protein
MKRLVVGSIVLATLVLALGCAMGAFWGGAVIVMLLGALWLLGWRRGWTWTNTLALVGNVIMAALGVWLRIAPLVLLLGVVAALAAWDLFSFAARLRRTPQVIGEASLVRAHLRRLGMVLGAGLLLGALSLTVRFGLSFGWALGLALLVGLGLRYLGRAIQQVEDEQAVNTVSEN